ncbi:hypothetical protein [Halosegnis longus]|uniref:hypothetical protein n=1 Tax=Halosegnis longus TaxID=2216012 RepID=UPI00096A52FB|nr:hypothetical protein [Salella cibi]
MQRLDGWLAEERETFADRTDKLARGVPENVGPYRATTAALGEKVAAGLLAIEADSDGARRRFDAASNLHAGAADAGTNVVAERYFALRAATLAGAKQAVPGLARQLLRAVEHATLPDLDERGALDINYYRALAAGAGGDAETVAEATDRLAAETTRLTRQGFFETTGREERRLYGGRVAFLEGVLDGDPAAVGRGIEGVLAHHDGGVAGTATDLPCREATFLATVATAAGLDAALPESDALMTPLVDATALPDGLSPTQSLSGRPASDG